MIAATSPELIAEVRIDSHWLAVQRGPAPLEPDGFRLDVCWRDSFGYLR